MGGLSIGVFWGFLVSAVGLAALSLSSPLPERGAQQEVAAVVAAEAEVEAADVEVEAAGVEVEDVPDESVEPAVSAPVEETPADAEATPADAEEAATDVEEAPLDAEAGPATEIPLPSGSEFNRPPPEPEAALPTPDAAPSATVPQAPTLVGDESAPSFDTTPAAQPDVATDGPAQIAALGEGGTAPASPALAPAPAIASGPTALTQPEASDTPLVRTALLPQITEPAVEESVEEVAEEVVEEVTEVTPEPEAVPLQTPTFPVIGEGVAPETGAPAVPADVPTEDVAILATPTFPQTSGLPQVAPEVPSVEEATTPERTPEGTPEAAPQGNLPAIQAHAVPFDDTEDRPLMAIVLIDEPDSRIEISTLTRFSFPVAFAVDPLHPDAAERARAYREAGFEVVILGSMIPEGATAADFEVAFAAAQDTLPEAVALIDTPEGRIQGDRPVLDATVAALAASGHGLMAFPRGLNAAEQSASRVGVPGATLFRLLDDEEQRATVITRFLARAAFTATQEGTVIVAGRTRPDTVTALFSWALGGRSEGVALAPVSATLLRAASAR